MITGFVTGQKLTITQPFTVADTIDYLTAQFVFNGKDWDGLNKWAHFKQGEKVYDLQLENDAINRNAHLNLAAGEWEVYLHGSSAEGMRITTQPVKVRVNATGMLNGKPLPAVPPSAAEQIAATAKRAEDKADEAVKIAGQTGEQAIAAAASAKKAAESETAAGQHAEAAKGSETAAADSQQSASESAGKSEQALTDLLAMMGSDIATLVGGKIPMSQIPATVTQEIYTVKSESELTGLKAQRGDLAELIEDVLGAPTITKTWQCLGDATQRQNWVVWGTSYAVQAGNASTAGTAENANKINGHRMVEMELAQWEGAVKDPSTYYLVYDGGAEA